MSEDDYGDEALFEAEPLQRDHYGRPLIVPPVDPDDMVATKDLVPYTRCSTFAKSVSDSSGLTKWKIRQVVKGLGMDPSVVSRVNAQSDNRVLDLVASHAHETAGANESARKGTAIHGLTEWHDTGEEFDRTAPGFAEYMPFVDEYARLTKNIAMLEVERFVVNDVLRVAGTFDRLCKLPDGRVVIGDLKTGKSAADNPHEAAIQMATYGRGVYYDPVTGERTPITGPDGGPIDTSVALLIHVPSNGAKAGLYLLDTDAAWEAALLSEKVRLWRSAKIKSVFDPDAPPF